MLHDADESSASSVDNEEESHSWSFDDDLEIFVLAESDIFFKRYVMPRGVVPKSSVYVADILPNLDDRRYRAGMRMSRASFDRVLATVEGEKIFQDTAKYNRSLCTFSLLLPCTDLGIMATVLRKEM